MLIETERIALRHCQSCFKEPKNKEKFTYIKVTDNDNRPIISVILCDDCKRFLENQI